jgi:hypothetical protein
MALTEEQKRLRAEAYGASEVATIVGSGYGKLIDLYGSKVKPDFSEENLDDMLAAELGTLEEEPTARVYARKTGTFLHRVRTLRHPTKPLAVATPDRARFVSEEEWKRAHEKAHAKYFSHAAVELDADELEDADRLVEVKTHAARYRRDYGPAGTGQIPEHEAIQTTWQMGVTGKRIVDVPVLFRSDWGVRFEVFTVGFNEELFESLYEAVERFHRNHVLAQKPPPPDGSEAYDKEMERLHSVVNKAPMVATADDEEMMLRFAKFSEVERRAGILKAKVGQALKDRIRDAGGLISPTLGKLSWILVRERPEVDWKKAANDALTIGGLVLNGMQKLNADDAKPSAESIAELANRLKAIVPDATKQRNGYRYLRLFPEGEAKLELARLNVALDALGDGQ